MATISHTAFPNAFLMERFVLVFEFHWHLFQSVQLTISEQLFRAMAWRWAGDKPLLKPILTQFTDVYMRHLGADELILTPRCHRYSCGDRIGHFEWFNLIKLNTVQKSLTERKLCNKHAYISAFCLLIDLDICNHSIKFVSHMCTRPDFEDDIWHYSDVMPSQIIGKSTVYSTVRSRMQHKKHKKLCVTGPVTGRRWIPVTKGH